MGSESIAHESIAHEAEVGQKNIETKHLSLVKLDFNPFLPPKHYKYDRCFRY